MSSGVAARVAELAGRDVAEARVAGRQHGYEHVVVTFADGSRAFAKVASGSSGSSGAGAAFDAEARGLRWLAEADAVPVPSVLGVDSSALVISMVPDLGSADRGSAFGFGADLARLHGAGAESFGAPWPGVIASLPLDNTPGDSWPSWYASRRLLPFARCIDPASRRLLDAVIDRIGQLAGPSGDEPPSRTHGDCWSGNVLWSGGRGWLIDPAAHGGHRETDLAMLALFGAPHLDAILAGYESVTPLAGGWRSRIPLHQLHPLLVHVCLYGPSYLAPLQSAARTALSAP